MVVRKMVKIDAEKCNGCGACVDACHEGAIGMKDGKAVLLRDDYCDGLGDCLPACPVDAISFEEREALPYDEAAVLANMAKKESQKQKKDTLPCGCPGSESRYIMPQEASTTTVTRTQTEKQPSMLRQWPVQIKLVPENAPYFNNAKLLIAADCTAYAYGNFHQDFMKDHVTLIGCPKLDMVQYADKLTNIIKNNTIQSVKVVRMQVPCCGGIQNAVTTAIQNSGKMIPWSIVTIAADGSVVEEL